jgi:hypothetical protein
MTNRALILASLIALSAASAFADERQTLGWGRLFDNDLLGDMHDRWHSGAYTVSLLRGPEWSGQLATGFGDILEYRFSGSTVTPDNISAPAADDRRYVAPLSFGIKTHLYWRGFEANLGADLVAIGPQTGIGDFQSWLHELLGAPQPDLTNEIGNAFYPTVQAELGREFALSDQVSWRPFVSAQAGVETMVRAGGDLVIGSFGKGGLLLRDDTTGQRYSGIKGDASTGLSFTLGGDVAHVFDSALLPEGGAAVASETRGRLRAGMAWQGAKSSAFYGITYLTPDFDSQPTGQLVGSVNLNLRF